MFPSNTNAAADLSKLNKITNVSVSNTSSSPGQFSLVIDQNGAIAYKAFALTNPNRLIIDICNAWVPGVKQGEILVKDNDVVSRVRVHQNTPDNVRLVIDVKMPILKSDYRIRVSQGGAVLKKPGRLVLECGPERPASKAEQAPAKPSPEPSDPFPTPKPIKYYDKPGLAGKIIVLDPGHGGSDPGAIGLNNTYEANVTLNVASELRRLLEKNGTKVIMTRTTNRDVFGPNASATQELQARCDVAKEAKADLFVSIHTNSFSNRSVGGTSTYYYPKTTGDVRLADFIQKELSTQTCLLDRGTNPARFYVLKYADMPAVLLELAFISNPVEEKLLTDEEFIKKTALGIYNGLVKYYTVRQ